MQELQAKKNYKDFKTELDNELKKSVESFVRIGYLLKVARDTDILHESGYSNMQEFAKAEYNLSKDQVSRFIAINDKYSIDGYSDRLQEKYEGYGVAKLAEMLTLPEAVADIIVPEMTRAEIQEIKREVKEEQEVSDIEVILEKKDTNLEGMNLTQKFMHRYFYENRLDFIGMAAVIQGELETTEEEIEETMQVLAPSGIATKKVRIAGIGKLFLSIKGKDNNLDLVNVRTNETETMSWINFLDDVCSLYESGASKKDWEAYYNEPFETADEEVAPVQPKKELTETEEKQIPGQMNGNDYPEITPEGGQTVDNTQIETQENIEMIKCEEESADEIPNVEEIAEIVEKETAENVEKIKCEDTQNDVEEVDRKAIENAQELIRAIAIKDYEGANYIINTLKKQIEMLINVEKTE